MAMDLRNALLRQKRRPDERPDAFPKVKGDAKAEQIMS